MAAAVVDWGMPLIQGCVKVITAESESELIM